MQRVWVVGSSGAGKSTTARQLAAQLGVEWVELDAIFHLPGWEELDLESFRAAVGEIVAAEAWVVDGNYSAVADLIRARADTIVWIDLRRAEVMRQLVPRTLSRIARRETLWNGNRERWRNLFRLDPNESILRWAWTQHASITERYRAMSAETDIDGTTFVRLTSRAEIEQFLAATEPG